MIDHERIEERLTVYVLGGMDPIERAAFEAEFEPHRAGCRRCTKLYRELSEVGTSLALTAPPVQPPAGLEDRIVELATGRAEPSNVRRFPGGPLRRARVAAAAVALVVVGWIAGSLTGREASPLRVAALSGSTSGELAVAFVPGSDRAVVVGHALPTPPGDRVYQLWVRSEGGMLPGPTFSPSGGTVLTEVRFPTADYDLVAITVEPPGGSAQPTSDPIAAAEIE